MFKNTHQSSLTASNEISQGDKKSGGLKLNECPQNTRLHDTQKIKELSCTILSLCFLEEEEEIYSLDDLKESY